MEVPELIPALCSRLHSSARIFALTGAPAPEKSGLLRGKTVRPLQRLLDIAGECGFAIEEAAHYQSIGTEAPDVVVFEGAAILHPAPTDKAHANGAPSSHSAPDLETVRAMQLDPALDAATFVAIISDRLSDEEIVQLQEAGVGGIVREDASPIEMAVALNSAVELCRARCEIAALRAQITRGLRVDDVTGVMTRRFFFQQAHRECARARRYGHPLSCLMVEIDHYRMLCARYGDSVGESVLRSIASIIGQWTRDSDIIARFAESKFVVLLPETDIDGATFAREKLLNALKEQPPGKAEAEMPVSVSVGESQLKSAPLPNTAAQESSESDDMGETALSTREAMAGLLEDADAALSISRKGARVPDLFVRQMFVEVQTPDMKLSE